MRLYIAVDIWQKNNMTNSPPDRSQLQRSFKNVEPAQSVGQRHWSGDVSAVHFGDQSKPVRLVFLHANGFNALSYRSILDPIAKEQNIHCLSLDLRGHGMTDLRDTPGRFANFYAYAHDVKSYLDRYVPNNVILAGHSLGASTAILTAHLMGERIEKVLAFDPIVLPKMARLIMSSRFGRNHFKTRLPLAKAAGRRREHFDSFQQVFDRFHGRGTFKQFSDDALWDYIHGGFVPIDNDMIQGVKLACAPIWEQYTYISQSHDLIKAVRRLPQDSHILITNFVKQSNWMASIGKRRPDLTLDHLPDHDHFFPLINPEISIPALRQIVQSV